MSLFAERCKKTICGVGCRSPPFNLDLNDFQNPDWRKLKWRIWKEAKETVLRKCGIDESTMEEIRTYDRAEFNSNRRFYRRTSDFGEYLEGMAEVEPFVDVKTVADLLDEIENENQHRVLLTVDKRTLQIVLLKMQGYSIKEIAFIVRLTTGAIYARLDHLRKNCGNPRSKSKIALPYGLLGEGLKTSRPIFRSMYKIFVHRAY